MKETVRLVYNKGTNELDITCSERTMDVTCIKNVPVEQWLYPFFSNGIKWKGLYEELVDFVGVSEFILRFDGDDDALQLIRRALAQKPVKVVGNNNIVTITYTESPYVTKITVNGNVFNTMVIQNRCIEEWLQPIHIRNIHWDGIYNELEKFIGADTYTIYFIGEPEFMSMLCENCPSTVSVFYREAKKPSIMSAQSASGAATGAAAINKVSSVAKKAFENIQESASASPEAICDKIPIKNPFIKQHLVTILMGIAMALLILPFATFTAKVDALGMSAESPEIVSSGFETMFGIKQIPVGTNSTIFGFLLIIIPVLVICSNYVKPLQKMRHWLVRGLPILGIIAEIITVFSIKGAVSGLLNTAAGLEGGVGGMVDMKVGIGLGIGFLLILAVYALTAVVGFILYGSDDLKNLKELKNLKMLKK